MKFGIISDAHGNVEAFRVAVSLLRERGAQKILFLGDAVGYFPGTAVVDEMMASDDFLPIAGNHEVMLLDGNIPPERDAVYRLVETLETMNSGHLEFMRSWPRKRVIRGACGNMLLVHGSPSDETYGRVYPQTDLSQFNMAAGTTVLMGHTHHPFIRKNGAALFVNVGSCGLPRDCGNLGAACLFDDTAGNAEILRFNIDAATRLALRRCGPVHPSVGQIFERRSAGTVSGAMIYD
jgi:putative phosphoesterase